MTLVATVFRLTPSLAPRSERLCSTARPSARSRGSPPTRPPHHGRFRASLRPMGDRPPLPTPLDLRRPRSSSGPRPTGPEVPKPRERRSPSPTVLTSSSTSLRRRPFRRCHRSWTKLSTSRSDHGPLTDPGPNTMDGLSVDALADGHAQFARATDHFIRTTRLVAPALGHRRPRG